MSKEVFAVVDNATNITGMVSMQIYGCPVTVEWQMSSLQERGQWQIEVRPANDGAAQFNLARDNGVYLVAVANCDPVNLSEQVGTLESKQREVAAHVLRNLALYGMTEIRVVKGEQEVLCYPIVGDRDDAPFEDTHDLKVDPPRRFRVYHYAPYKKSDEQQPPIELQTTEPVQWHS